ncbi:MAG: hypothetical protein ABFD50_17300 [Smithella sp.]
MIKTRKIHLFHLHVPAFPVFLTALFLFCLVGGYLAFFVHRGEDTTDIQEGMPPAKPAAKQQIPPQMPSATIDIAKSYPFILPNGATAAAMTVPAQNSVPVSTSLPVIPNYQPRPEGLPMPSLPAIPGSGYIAAQNSPMQLPVSSPAAAAIQGIFTGNSGANMAILSDGKLVKEGDAYGESRIAVIGGDGIQLENGNSISYGIKGKGE